MCDIKKGMVRIIKPKFDWKTRSVIHEEICLDKIDIILFEGTYVLTGDEAYNFDEYNDLRLFIYADDNDIVAWNWHRENACYNGYIPREREKFDKDIAWDMEDYHKNILPTMLKAHFIIEKNTDHLYSLK
jgi:pantothenate kinase